MLAQPDRGGWCPDGLAVAIVRAHGLLHYVHECISRMLNEGPTQKGSNT